MLVKGGPGVRSQPVTSSHGTDPVLLNVPYPVWKSDTLIISVVITCSTYLILFEEMGNTTCEGLHRGGFGWHHDVKVQTKVVNWQEWERIKIKSHTHWCRVKLGQRLQMSFYKKMIPLIKIIACWFQFRARCFPNFLLAQLPKLGSFIFCLYRI